jgi:hypothetical protein
VKTRKTIVAFAALSFAAMTPLTATTASSETFAKKSTNKSSSTTQESGQIKVGGGSGQVMCIRAPCPQPNNNRETLPGSKRRSGKQCITAPCD